MNSSRIVFTHQTLLTSLRVHMYVKGAVEEWLEGGDAGEVSRNQRSGGLFGTLEPNLSLRSQVATGKY